MFWRDGGTSLKQIFDIAISKGPENDVHTSETESHQPENDILKPEADVHTPEIRLHKADTHIDKRRFHEAQANALEVKPVAYPK